VLLPQSEQNAYGVSTNSRVVRKIESQNQSIDVISICVTNSYPCMCHELAHHTNDVLRNTSLSWHIYGYEFVTHLWNPYAYRLRASYVDTSSWNTYRIHTPINFELRMWIWVRDTHVSNPYAHRLEASLSFSLPVPYSRPATMRVVEEEWGLWVYCALMRHAHIYRLRCTVMMCHELMSIYVSRTDPHQTWDYLCTREVVRERDTHTD